MQKQVSMGLNLYNQQAFVTKDAREMLFEGYEDDLINMAQEISNYGPIKLNIPYDRFGWLYGVSSNKLRVHSVKFIQLIRFFLKKTISEK